MVVGDEDSWLLLEVVSGSRCWLLAMMIINWLLLEVGNSGCWWLLINEDDYWLLNLTRDL